MTITANRPSAPSQSAYLLRQDIRSGQFRGHTSGLAPGCVQGNLIILPKEWAQDFLTYCYLNPIACPLISLSKPGDPTLPSLGLDIDIRSDVPEYQIFIHGELKETVTHIHDYWSKDLVVFVMGCSFSFEEALLAAGLHVRNIESNCNVSMYNSTIPTQSSEKFFGNTVVSMRPFTPADAIKAIQVTTRFPKAHGAPLHLGFPDMIGIRDLSKPDYGDSVIMQTNELPVFWGCGVTTQVAIQNAKPALCITHVPGKMLVTDKLNGELAVF